MVCWAKAAVAAAAVVSCWLQGASASSSTWGGQGQPEHSFFNDSNNDCQNRELAYKKAAQLFTRRLTKEEYNSRNFMWIRCRCEKTSIFDMGGLWFGPNGRNLWYEIQKSIPVHGWHFRYTDPRRQGGLGKQGWGDAEVVMYPRVFGQLQDFVRVIVQAGQKASIRYHRTLYIIDCPGAELSPVWGTERSKIRFPFPRSIPSKEDLVTIYNANVHWAR
ncbi:hypothetical protein RJ55_04403 [Drechmeria coniospora]|nr:hypothetical protein RJ55_04403 [Drechmeria coniospora]